MLDAGDAMKQVTFKRTACPNGSSKTPGEGPRGALTITTITAEEAVAGIKDIRVKVR